MFAIVLFRLYIAGIYCENIGAIEEEILKSVLKDYSNKFYKNNK